MNYLFTNIWTYFTSVIFILVILLFNLNFKRMMKNFRSIKKATWLCLLIIVVIAIGLRINFSLWRHEVFYDEWDYLESARAILKEGRFGLCNHGNIGNCNLFVPAPHQIGYPFLLSVGFLLFGINSKGAMLVNLLLSTGSTALMFFAAYLLFKNEEIGLWSSLLFALNPLSILFCTTAISETSSLFFIVLSIVLFLTYLKSPHYMSLFLFLFTAVFAIQIRPENILILPLFAFNFLMKKRNKGKEKYKVLFIFIALAILLVPNILYLKYASESGRWNPEFGKRFSVENIKNNIRFFFHWLFDLNFFITAMSIAGMIFLMLEKRKNLHFLTGWLVIFFSFFLSYYWKELRFLLIIYPALLILGGKGCCAAHKILTNNKIIRKIILITLLFMIFISSIHAYKETLQSVGSAYNYESQKEIDFIREMNLKDGYLITCIPFVINFEKNEQKTIFFPEDNWIKETLKNGKRIFFYKNNFCCQINFPEYCDGISKKYKLNILKSKEDLTLFEIAQNDV